MFNKTRCVCEYAFVCVYVPTLICYHFYLTSCLMPSCTESKGDGCPQGYHVEIFAFLYNTFWGTKVTKDGFLSSSTWNKRCYWPKIVVDVGGLHFLLTSYDTWHFESLSICHLALSLYTHTHTHTHTHTLQTVRWRVHMMNWCKLVNVLSKAFSTLLMPT